MKRFIYILSSILILLFILFSMPRTPVPQLDQLIGATAHSAMVPQLFYTPITPGEPLSYAVVSDSLTPIHTNYSIYTEGFVATDFFEKLMGAFEGTPFATRSFHDMLFLENYAIVAFSGGLESIFIVDPLTSTAYPLHFDPVDNLGSMYVSHMKIVKDTLIIVGGKAHDYGSFIYTVSLDDLSVTSSYALDTDEHALYEEDFTILSSGQCIFNDASGLLVYDPFTQEQTTHLLAQPPSRLLAYEDTALLFTESASTLHVQAVGNTGSLTLQMPTTHYTIVDLATYDNFLFILLFDPEGIRYTNYLSTYDLETGKWVDGKGIYPLSSHILTSFTLVATDALASK